MRKSKKVRAPEWQLPLFSFVAAVTKKRKTFAAAISKKRKTTRVMVAALLPPDAIVRVASFLPPADKLRYAHTCTEAKEVILGMGSQTALLWSQMDTADLGLAPNSADGLVCAALKSCFRRCASLTIDSQTVLTNNILETVAKGSAKLVNLSLHGRSLFVPTRLGFGFLMVLNAAHSLRSLDLVGCTISPRMLAGIAEKCPLLSHFTIKASTDSEADEEDQVTTEHLIPLHECQQLRRIDISQRANFELDYSAIETLAASQRQIRRISLNGCAVDDEALCALGVHCPNLEMLQCLRSCHTRPLTVAGIKGVLEKWWVRV
jgi:hypothetical protein